jgi:hypothetical protein
MYAPAYMDRKTTGDPGFSNTNHRANRPVPEGRLNFTQDAVLGLTP